MRYQDITMIKIKKIAKNLLMEDVKETKTTITPQKGVLKPVVIALVSQKKDPAEQEYRDIITTKIIKLAKGLFMEAVVETATTTPLRRTVLKPVKLKQ